MEKRLELVDKEIEYCAKTRNRKICYENLLEIAGIPAEAAKFNQGIGKSEKKDKDFTEVYAHGIENFDPKNRLLSLRSVGSLKNITHQKQNSAMNIQNQNELLDQTDQVYNEKPPKDPKNLIKKLNEEKQARKRKEMMRSQKMLELTEKQLKERDAIEKAKRAMLMEEKLKQHEEKLNKIKEASEYRKQKNDNDKKALKEII